MNEEDIMLYGTLYRDFCLSREMEHADAEDILPCGWMSSSHNNYCISSVPTLTYDNLTCFKPKTGFSDITANLLLNDRKKRLTDYMVMCHIGSLEEATILAESLGRTLTVVEGFMAYHG